jgi:hypothetical protein
MAQDWPAPRAPTSVPRDRESTAKLPRAPRGPRSTGTRDGSPCSPFQALRLPGSLTGTLKGGPHGSLAGPGGGRSQLAAGIRDRKRGFCHVDGASPGGRSQLPEACPHLSFVVPEHFFCLRARDQVLVHTLPSQSPPKTAAIKRPGQARQPGFCPRQWQSTSSPPGPEDCRKCVV